MSGFSRRRAVRIGGLSVVIRPRVIGVTGILALVALSIAAMSVATGTYRLELSGVVDALTGGGTATARYLVVEQRLPRAVAALLVGCCLGVSGALFQSVSRNPLGSPDIIGFTTGAATGGLVVILLTPSPSALSIAGGTIASEVWPAPRSSPCSPRHDASRATASFWAASPSPRCSPRSTTT